MRLPIIDNLQDFLCDKPAGTARGLFVSKLEEVVVMQAHCINRLLMHNRMLGCGADADFELNRDIARIKEIRAEIDYLRSAV